MLKPGDVILTGILPGVARVLVAKDREISFQYIASYLYDLKAARSIIACEITEIVIRNKTYNDIEFTLVSLYVAM